jgi:formylglycine-generating enzyme required for sulfatase activity
MKQLGIFLALLFCMAGFAKAQESTETPASALERAVNFDGAVNADWEIYTQTFEDGVEMALVPRGCFIMGLSDEQIQAEQEALALGAGWFDDVSPAHEICFDKAFWMDVTEVSQRDFERLGGEKALENRFSGLNYPVHNITWYEEFAFCELRGGRLPTEAEWEYAARGIESLAYPWGNEFAPELLNYCDESCQSVTHDSSFNDGYSNLAPIGTFPEGASWVGALDMLGNVSEWTNSMYLGYPYSTSYREDFPAPDDFIAGTRTIRGLSWAGRLAEGFATTRFYRDVEQSSDFIGLRCVRDVD